MIDLRDPVDDEFFPVVVQDDLLDPSTHADLLRHLPPPAEFGKGFRMHGDLTAGDARYEELLADSQTWRQLHDYVYSEALVNDVIGHFEPNIELLVSRGELLVDPREGKFNPRVEGRAISKSVADEPVGRVELYSRLDLGYGSEGYGRRGGGGGIHIDNASRLVSGLVYFSDQSDMVGGEFELVRLDHEGKECGSRLVPIRQNRGVVSLQTNSAFHRVRPVVSCERPRYALYFAIASRTRLWRPIENRSLARRSQNRHRNRRTLVPKRLLARVRRGATA